MREETERADEEEPVTVTLGAEEVEIAALLLELVLEAKGLLNLGVFKENGLVGLIAVGVVCRQTLAIGTLTKGRISGLHFARIFSASGPRSSLISHLGDSGTQKSKQNCPRDGRAWRMEGMRHAQLFWMLKVPYVNHVATMAPKFHRQL